MSKMINLGIDEKLMEESNNFLSNTKSKMKYTSSINSDLNSLEWLDLIEEVCPYIDKLVRTPKVSLVSQTEVRKIEKAKKTSVESVKNLSKHTDYIDKIDEVTGDVLPSKLLVALREETFNTYENRYIYTIIMNLLRFIKLKEEEFKHLEVKDYKSLNYTSTTTNGKDKVDIEVKITTRPTSKSNDDSTLKEINYIKKRFENIMKFINTWLASEFITSLEKEHAPLVSPPIRKTNLILRNPNFQMATKLWDFLYSVDDDKSNASKGLDSRGNQNLKRILDNAFLADYYVIDSISADKRLEKESINKYALLLIANQVQNTIDLLLSNGIKINQSELLKMLEAGTLKEKSASQIGSIDIKKKFQHEMDEYLKKTNELL